MIRALAWILAVLLLTGGCAQYERKPVPFRLPSASPNAVQVLDATIAARALDDPAEVQEIFGFDLIGAGLLPVQVVFDHQGRDPIEIVPSQTFLIDRKSDLWAILDQHLAYSRIEKKTSLGQVAPQAGKGAVLGAAAGAVVGAAIGIVAGRDIGGAVGKGAAAGAATGAVIGGARGIDDPAVRQAIREDLRHRSLENRPIPPQGLSHGVLFFPAEAIPARELRLQLRDTRTGETRVLGFAL